MGQRQWGNGSTWKKSSSMELAASVLLLLLLFLLSLDDADNPCKPTPSMR